MKTIAQIKKKQKAKLTTFFSGFTEKSNVPIRNNKGDLPLISSAFVSADFRHIPKNYDELAEIKSEKLHEVLNRFIEKGIKFDVSADDFKVIDVEEKLKTSDIEFLNLNEPDVLCQLQQSLLMKHLFSIAPELFEDFAFEVEERESIMAINNEESFPSQTVAVKDVTKNQFYHLLNKIKGANKND